MIKLIYNKYLQKDQHPYIICKDHTVSQEDYQLYYNEELDLLFTHPIPTDLSKYYESKDYISHTDSSKNLIDKVYKIVRNYTLKKKLKLINSLNTEGKKLLDIGSGTGDFLKICKENNWNVSGVEPSKNAKEKANKKGVNVKSTIENYTDEKFDIITMWHVLEHISNLDEYILILKKLLKTNGKLIIAVPNYKSYDAKYYKEYWAAYDVPRHITHFSRNSISKIFKKVNISLVKEVPMIFDSYYVSLLSEKYKKGNMKPISAFYRGLLSNLKANKNKEYSSIIYVLKNDK